MVICAVLTRLSVDVADRSWGFLVLGRKLLACYGQYPFISEEIDAYDFFYFIFLVLLELAVTLTCGCLVSGNAVRGFGGNHGVHSACVSSVC